MLWVHLLIAATTSEDPSETINAAARTLPPCLQKIKGNPVRSFLALEANGGAEQARACLLQYLSSGQRTAVAWALAASAFVAHAEPFALQAKRLLRDRANQRTPTAYDVLGPMPIGKNEVDGDPLEPFGGALSHWLSRPRGGLVASELVPGGRVGWRSVKVDPAHQGAVRISFPEVNWQGLMQAMSQRAVLEVQAWAIGSLAVAVDGHYRLDCKGVHKVHLVSVAHVSRPPKVIAADIYSSAPYGGGGFGVGRLRAGAYLVLMRVRAVAQAAPSCALWPAPAEQPMSVGASKLLPDLILPSDAFAHERLCGGYTVVHVRNLGSAGWLHNVSVRELPADAAAVRVEMVDGRTDVAPGQLRLLPIRLRLLAGSSSGRRVACPFGLMVEVSAMAVDSTHATAAGRGLGRPLTQRLRIGGLQCRRPEQSVVCTFIDHDRAVSAVAVVRPLESERCHPRLGCPAVVSLHGTSIPVRDSADAYKMKPRGAPATDDYTFGVARFWLVAPTRHSAHNWEQGGRLSALRALDELARMSGPHGLLPSPTRVDAMRVCFAGHSMGGHGAWIAALQAAERTLGVAAVSGWTKKETCKPHPSEEGNVICPARHIRPGPATACCPPPPHAASSPLPPFAMLPSQFPALASPPSSPLPNPWLSLLPLLTPPRPHSPPSSPPIGTDRRRLQLPL